MTSLTFSLIWHVRMSIHYQQSFFFTLFNDKQRVLLEHIKIEKKTFEIDDMTY